MADWFEDYLNTLISRMQMAGGQDNLVFQVNQIRLIYKQAKSEGKI